MLNSVTDKQLNVYCTVEANGSVNSVVKPEETVYLPPLPLSKEGENLLTKTEADETYAKKTEYATNSTPGTVKVGGPYYGLYITSYGLLTVHGAFTTDIDAKIDGYRPITSHLVDHVVKVGLTTNTEVLTDEEKYLATTWLGAVKHADTPTGYAAVYAIDRQGNDITVFYSPQVSSFTIAQRGTGGTLLIGEPTDDRHATTKNYVDNLPDKITDGTIKAKWLKWLGSNEVTPPSITSTYIEPSFFNKYF
jgi:hypothetical protein